MLFHHYPYLNNSIVHASVFLQFFVIEMFCLVFQEVIDETDHSEAEYRECPLFRSLHELGTIIKCMVYKKTKLDFKP